MLCNTIRKLRELRGLSQAELARRVGTSRQALNQVESMRVVPGTTLALRIAHVFGEPVESVFFESADEPLWSAVCDEEADERIQIGDRVLLLQPRDARDLLSARKVPQTGFGTPFVAAPAVGVAVRRDVDGHLSVAHPPGVTPRPSIVVAGCDIGLGLLVEHARSSPRDAMVVWENADNQRALRQLALGLAHAAAVHLPAGESLTAPAAIGPCVRLHFARWQLGWMVRRGNPEGFHDASQLAGGRLRLANRAAGSGTRTLFDRLLAAAGVLPESVAGYHAALDGHLQVASAVASGLADVGIGIGSAAASAGLDFLPVQEEICELVIPADERMDERLAPLFDVMHSGAFRWDLERFGPYDVTRLGERTVMSTDGTV